MATNPLIYKNAEKVRDSITESQKKAIAQLYNDWAKDIAKMAEYYKNKTTASSPLSERYYKELMEQLTKTSHEVSNEIYKGLKQSMYIVSDAVIKDNAEWLQKFGFPKDGLNAAFSYVPDSVVRSIVTGQVYDTGWSLSKRIWGDNEQTMQDLYRIVAGGVAKQTPIYDIAKQLEKYVKPEAAKQWNLTDKDGKKIYPRQVDYNAQRLARTLIQHSYQQAFTAVNEKNPFVIDYIWNANGSRVCELCSSRDGQHYKKDELPLDHPNGMCVMEPNIAEDMTQQLVDWFNSDDGTYPEIDEFAKQFGYDSSKFDAPKFTNLQNKYLGPYGFNPNNMPKNFDDWSHKISFDQATEILNSMGTDWGDPHPYQKLKQYFDANLAGIGKNMIDQNKQKPVEQKSEKSEKKVKVPEFTAWQNKYLAPYGYIAGGKIPSYEEWYFNATFKDYQKMQKEADKLGMSIEEFYAKKVEKVKYKYKAESEVKAMAQANVQALVTSNAPEYTQWIEMARKNVESAMLAMEDKKQTVLTDSEREGLRIYSGSAYTEINGYLRNLAAGMSPEEAKRSSGISQSYIEAIENTKSALSKMKLDEGLVVRRGTDLGDLAGLFMTGDFYNNKQELKNLSAEELNAKFQGAIGQYAGFTSTSSLWERGFSGDVEVVLNLPPGTEAASIMRISRYGTSEGETLLNAGTMVKCQKIEKSDGHQDSDIRVFLDVIPKE